MKISIKSIWQIYTFQLLFASQIIQASFLRIAISSIQSPAREARPGGHKFGRIYMMTSGRQVKGTMPRARVAEPPFSMGIAPAKLSNCINHLTIFRGTITAHNFQAMASLSCQKVHEMRGDGNTLLF
jgi:hypothetical protein